MGIFGLFKSDHGDNSAAKEDYDRAIELYDSGEFQKALGSLVLAFGKDVIFKPSYELAVKCLNQLGASEEASLFERAQRNLRKFDSFQQLGSHFFEVGHYDLALPFLEKAVSLDNSHSETVHDLALVFARRFQIAKAIEVFEKNKALNDFWNCWFWCKLKVLDSQTEGVEDIIRQLELVLAEVPEDQENEFARVKLQELNEILLRYQAVPEPQSHIRDWHFIQYGSAILDFFDEEEDQDVAGGRYVALWGGNDLVKKVVLKLKLFLEKMELPIERVSYLEDRDSEILGRTVAQALGVEGQPYQGGCSTENSLFVAVHSSDYDNYPELAEIKSGQVTFALNHCWLEPAVICPDIVGLMSQSYFLPWAGGGFKVSDSENGGFEPTEPDERKPAEIAHEIIEHEVSQEDQEPDYEFYLSHRDHLKGIGNNTIPLRYNFMIESPVPGSFFI